MTPTQIQSHTAETIAPSEPIEAPRHDWQEEYAEICHKTRPATVTDCPTD